MTCRCRWRPRLEQLHAAGILGLNNGAYQASHAALFSSYLLPPRQSLPASEEADDLRDFPGRYEQLELIGYRNRPWYLNEVIEQEPLPST